MLVLAATFRSKHLSFLIPQPDLLRLLNRTIDFLESLGPISTTLAKDASLLRVIKDRLDGHPRGSVDMRLTSSFGSSH